MFCIGCCFFKQKTAYEMRISDWSSDVCSSDLNVQVNRSLKRGSAPLQLQVNEALLQQVIDLMAKLEARTQAAPPRLDGILGLRGVLEAVEEEESPEHQAARLAALQADLEAALQALVAMRAAEGARLLRSEEHTSELQSLMRISYAVFCLQQKITHIPHITKIHHTDMKI